MHLRFLKRYFWGQADDSPPRGRGDGARRGFPKGLNGNLTLGGADRFREWKGGGVLE